MFKYLVWLGKTLNITFVYCYYFGTVGITNGNIKGTDVCYLSSLWSSTKTYYDVGLWKTG